eukprot:6586326-Prymnesium_polylepis.1
MAGGVGATPSGGESDLGADTSCPSVPCSRGSCSRVSHGGEEEEMARRKGGGSGENSMGIMAGGVRAAPSGGGSDGGAGVLCPSVSSSRVTRSRVSRESEDAGGATGPWGGRKPASARGGEQWWGASASARRGELRLRGGASQATSEDDMALDDALAGVPL